MDLKSLNEAYDARSQMEKRMSEIIEFLTSPGPDGKPPVGLHGNLLDKDGFPRNDIDIISIRTLRHELAVMRTAYEQLDQKLRDMTYSIFESMKSNPLPSQQTNSVQQEMERLDTSSELNDEEQETYGECSHETPTIDPLMERVLREEREQSSIKDWINPNDYFGSIRSTQPGGIADRAGIQDCDRIIRFGTIDSKSFTGLKQIAEFFENSRGSVIEVTVGRYLEDHYEMKTIELNVPEDPSERLGMHFVPKE